MLRRLVLSSLCVLGFHFVATAAPISFPSGSVPFSSIYYIAGPDANGNRLVEGILTNFVPNSGYDYGFLLIEGITPGAQDQQFSDSLIQLASDQWFSNVYVPTAAELQGDFRGVAFPILDPFTGNPLTGEGRTAFVGNLIPFTRLLDVFAFEIGPASTATPEPNARAMFAMTAALFGAGYWVRRKKKDSVTSLF